MIKTILVPLSGSATDTAVLEAAWAIGAPLHAHLQGYHVWITADDTAALTPHVDFAVGRGLERALALLKSRSAANSASAAKHFADFCAHHAIMPDDPGPRSSDRVTASFLEERDHAVQRLMFHARHHDLTILGRPRRSHALQEGFTRLLLLGCGRPLIVTAPSGRFAPAATVMVAWKETSEASRALAAAMPIIAAASNVILVHVGDNGFEGSYALEDLAGRLEWHGVAATTKTIPASRIHSAAHLLINEAADQKADLLVMGGYGHSRVHSIVLGSATETVLRTATVPVFILH